jgi:meso-butanediol dehydrogenase/(S,S)-butanediol dehydrogenase/diacetyl reductase
VTTAVTVVTGAASGIGAAIAGLLAERGHRIVATDVDATAGAAHAAAIGATFRQLDVTDDSDVGRLVADVVAEDGVIGAWVNNAGVSAMERFVDIPTDQLDRVLGVNLRAVFVCGQAAARAMIATGSGGRIVNVASMAGKQGRVPFLADYVASKFGVVGLTQAMAYELAPHGITVNSVCPGFVATPMQEREIGWEARLRDTSPDAVRQSWIDDTPLGRLEEPVDVARAVAFLLSPDAAFITGEALAVNGGAYMD